VASALLDLRLPSQPQDITALLTGTYLYSLVTETHWCEHLAQIVSYLTVESPRPLDYWAMQGTTGWWQMKGKLSKLGWLRVTVVERRSVTCELLLSYARPATMGDHLCG